MARHCQHCDPYQNAASHIIQRIENILHPFFFCFSAIEHALKGVGVYQFLSKTLSYALFHILFFFGLAREKEMCSDDPRIYNRTLFLKEAAEKRGCRMYVITLLGANTNFFTIYIGRKRLICEGMPTYEIGFEPRINFDDKMTFKRLLERQGLPVASGCSFRSVSKGMRCVKGNLGFPVVVKPSSSSASMHVTSNITTEKELREAIRIAKIVSPSYIVERHIPGYVHRATLIDFSLAACVRREAAHVVGDGIHSISELIGIKNSDPRRADREGWNHTLYRVAVNDITRHMLRTQGYTLDSILGREQKAYLHAKVVLASGGDLFDVSDEVHPDTRQLFERIAHMCHAPVMGLDFICEDISKPYTEQPCALLEANIIPFLDMHAFPTEGASRNLSGALMDYVIRAHSAS